LPFAPEHIRVAPETYRNRPKVLLESLFNSIGSIERKADRERIAAIFGKIGGSTPTFQVVAENLFSFVRLATEKLCDIAAGNLTSIDLGKAEVT
jgi:hypothetical protein